MSRPRSAAALLVAVVLLLAGCAAIPDSGSVQRGATAAPDAPDLIITPNGPSDGASQLDVVRGFVQAAGASPDYTVAREFLTPDLAKTWRPNARVLVHDDPWTPRQTADGRVQVSVPVAATVGADGVYTADRRRETLDFSLAQVKGQWRIASADDGIVLASRLFSSSFTPEVLRFFDQTGTRLVPDRRWFPRRGSTSTAQYTTVVRALLAGPAEPLTGVVADTFRSGTALAGPVTVSGGITTVLLTVPGARPTTAETNRIQQQIARSLTLTTTAGLRLLVNGSVVPRAPQLASTAVDGSQPVVLMGGRFGSLSSTGVTEDAVLGKRVAALAPTAVTVSSRQKLAAALTPAGVQIVGASGAARLVDRRSGLAAPTLDQQGWTYAIPRDEPDALMAYPSDGGRGVAVSTGSEAIAIDSIEVSPDGTRMLVVAQTGSSTVASVAGIVRQADGTPVALTSVQYSVSNGDRALTAATWIDDGSVALLTQSDDLQSVIKQPLGGLPITSGRLSSATTIVGGTDELDLRVLLDTGDVLHLQSSRWTSEFGRAVDVDVLAVQR